MLHVVPAGILSFPSGYTISNALMLDGTADYLARTPTSAGSTTKCTWSFWVKRSKTGDAEQDILNCETHTDGQRDGISFGDGSTADLLSVRFNDANDGHIKTNDLMRDVTAWQHWVVAIDTTQSTASNRVKIYKNGTQITAFQTASYPAEDYAMQGFMQDEKQHIGTTVAANNYWFNGYLAEFVGIDGSQLDASSFGERNSEGVWVPIKPPTSLGTNGFHLDFESTDIGNDAAGSNNWTAVVGTSNVTADSPTDDSSSEVTIHQSWETATSDQAGSWGTPSQELSNTKGGSSSGASYNLGTMSLTSGKWYWRVQITQESSGYPAIGVHKTTATPAYDGGYIAGDTNGWCILTEGTHNGKPRHNGTNGSALHTYSNGDYVDVALDMDNGKIWFGRNGTFDGNPAAGSGEAYSSISGSLVPSMSTSTSSYGIIDTSGGTPPTGFSQYVRTATGVGNHWTLNPLASTDTLTNGNLSFTAAANFTTYVTAPAIPMSGKWYYEVTATGGDQAIGTSASYDAYLGLVRTDVAIPTGSHDSNDNLWVIANWNPTPSGQKENGSSAGGSYAPTSGFGDGSIIMVAIDMDNNAMWFGNDGTWADSATASDIANGTTTNAAFTNSSNNSFGSNQMMPYHGAHSDLATYNFGATAFAYTPPTGFKALNTANLPAPTVTKPSDHFKAIIYEGAVVDSSSRHTASAVTLPDNTNTTFTIGGQTGSLAQIIDNDGSTAGIRITGAGAELSFDLGSAKAVGAVGMFMDNGGGNCQAGTWSVLYSDNNSDFTDTNQDVAYSDNAESSTTEVIKAFSGSHGTHRYWKLRVESKVGETASSGGIYGINLYSANAREITGVGFQPDFVWIKNRDASDNNMLFDSVRGATKDLHSNTADTEATTAESSKSFDTDGFTLGTDDQVNTSSESYVAWCWKAGTSWSEDAQNSNILASSGKKSSTAKFSIATWEHRTSANYAIKHNLGTTPEFFITKSVDQSTNWSCWHKDLVDTAKRIVLSTAKDEEASYWADASDSADGTGSYANISSGESPVTSTLFAIQDGEAGAGTFIGYFFARTPGLIGIGSYTGNNSTDGPYVVIDDGASGFRPAFLLLKEFDGSDNGSWFIRDSARNAYNPTNLDLYAQSSDDEYTDSNSDIDFTANGFKIRANAGGYNESGAKNLYLAFAEHPFGGDGVAQARAR